MPGECLVESVAQIDSKDMGESIWRDLLARCAHWRTHHEVSGIVITHGTDTLEETAFLLHWMLPEGCPVVITGAMWPSNAPQSDGPDNLRLALDWLASGHAQGVVVAFAGQIHHPEWVSKVHADELSAFSSGTASPLASSTEVGWTIHPEPHLLRQVWLKPDLNAVLTTQAWPRVDVFLHHAQAQPWWLSPESLALSVKGSPLRGVVLAGTGHGTFNSEWQSALERLQAGGIGVAISSRCAFSTVWPHQPDPSRMYSDHLNAVKTRIALQMHCLALDQELKA